VRFILYLRKISQINLCLAKDRPCLCQNVKNAIGNFNGGRPKSAGRCEEAAGCELVRVDGHTALG